MYGCCMAQRWGLRLKIGVCLFLLSPASAGCAAILVIDRDHHAAVDASRSGGDPHAAGDASRSGGGQRGRGFGAEAPSAVWDLGGAFTRVIGPACMADPIWSKLAVGSGGELEIAITVDDAGHITGFTPPSDDAPWHLVALVKRTLKLLGAGTFAIRSGSVSAGTEVLRISASLRDMDESEMKAAPASFGYDRGKGKGKAGFTQPGGRHVDVSVEVVRVVEGGTKP
jgi:hypothetical protein